MIREEKGRARSRRPRGDGDRGFSSVRRPAVSREELLARQQAREERLLREQESRELAKGPIDLPFCLLVMMLTIIGLIMLFSASFPRAYYEDGNPTYYVARQGVFAIMGVAAMAFVGSASAARQSRCCFSPSSCWCWWSSLTTPSP